jgi:ribonuclease J
MEIKILRGSDQIGGSCVEVLADNGNRIIVDFGLPLTDEIVERQDEPKINSEGLKALLISHPHADHFGLARILDKKIPVYIGKAALGIIEAAAQYNSKHSPSLKDRIKNFISDRKTFEIENTFKITPFLVDHSAYDAYAFLIEADGKKVFYSGDFRNTGRKGKLFDKFCRTAPKEIKNLDALLLEGTCIGNGKENVVSKKETELEKDFVEAIKNTKGIVTVSGSSQNIDRIVTISRACQKTKRIFVVAPHIGLIMMFIGNDNLPNFKNKLLKKWTNKAARSHEISTQTILKSPEKYVVFLKYEITNDFLSNKIFNEDAALIWSMWDGYKEKQEKTLARIEKTGTQMKDLHTSGHADIPTLQKFAQTLNPKIIIPMHTQNPKKYKELFDNVRLAADNEVIKI